MKRLVIDVNSIVHSLVTGSSNGIARTTIELVKALENSGNLPFEITLYSQNMKGLGGSYFLEKFKKIHFYLPYRDFAINFLSIFPLKELFNSYDLMHIPSNYCPVFNPEKTIFTLHDAFFMKFNDTNFDYLKMRQEVPTLMKKSKGIITCSYFSKIDIVETMGIDPKKIRVIYWGYNNNVFKPKDICEVSNIQKKYNLNNEYFLSYSCSSGRKNTDKLIQAFLLYLEKGGGKDLVLVWSNPPLEIKLIVTNSQFNQRIHFLSQVDDIDLSKLLQHSVSLIFPSSYEGFGLPVLEALACGTLVLTSNNSSLPEVGGEAAFYLNDLSTQGILKGIMNLEDKLDERDKRVEKGLAQARKFCWKKTACDYIQAYKDFLEIN